MSDPQVVVELDKQERIQSHFAHIDAISLSADWRILPGQHWLLLSGNDGQRRAVLDTLTVAMRQHNQLHLLPKKATIEISSRAQEAMIDGERIKAKIGLADAIVEPTLVREYLDGLVAAKQDPSLFDVTALLQQFQLNRLADKGLRQLSSGETRRLLLLAGLVQQAELLLLENPLEGVDRENRPIMTAMMSH